MKNTEKDKSGAGKTTLELPFAALADLPVAYGKASDDILSISRHGF